MHLSPFHEALEMVTYYKVWLKLGIFGALKIFPSNNTYGKK